MHYYVFNKYYVQYISITLVVDWHLTINKIIFLFKRKFSKV